MQPMLNIALRAARSAGELILRSTERLDVISVNEKDAKDYVTEIDRAAELLQRACDERCGMLAMVLRDPAHAGWLPGHPVGRRFLQAVFG